MQGVFGLLPVQFRVAQVHQDQVHVGAAVDHGDACRGDVVAEEPFGEQLRSLQDAFLAFLEFGGAGELESHGLGGDDMLQRAALLAGEHGAVDLAGVLFLGEDDAAARAAEGLVRGGGDDVGVRHRVGVQPGGHEAGEVRHIHHQVCVHEVGDAAELGEVELAGVGGPAGDNQFGAVLQGQRFDFGHVYPEVRFTDVVRDHVVELAGEVDAHAVGEVAAVRQVQAHDGVARVQQREHGRGVGLCTGVRLDVCEFRTEQGLDPVDGQLLHDVNVLAAAIVALARVALGVLVGQDRPLRLHDGGRGEILRGDHFQRRLLAAQLIVNGLLDLGIDYGKSLVQLLNHGCSF